MPEIRPLTDADIDAVARIHVRSWQAAYAGIVPADYLASLDPAVLAERRRRRSRTPGTHTLVAELDRRVIGFATFGPDRDDPRTGELYAIYVDPESWGAGAGRRLIEAAQGVLTEAGFPGMRLWVFTANDRARRFYERAGLRPDGETHYYTPGDTGVQLPELRYATPL
jgi:GNAT superfamily N-acetyltransferase